MPLLPTGSCSVLFWIKIFALFDFFFFLQAYKRSPLHVLCCHQILFLDNVDLNRLNKSHKVVPRLKVFDQESLRTMAVMCASRGEQDFSQFIRVCSRSILLLSSAQPCS